MRLTDKQREHLKAIQNSPTDTWGVVSRLSRGDFSRAVYYPTYDSVQACMRRLEDRELVRRVEDNPIQWQLTAQGRKAICPDYDEAHGHGIGPSAEYDDIEC